jgi:hypothetical protein
LLEQDFDVDLPDDLALLAERLHSDPSLQHSHTALALRALSSFPVSCTPASRCGLCANALSALQASESSLARADDA